MTSSIRAKAPGRGAGFGAGSDLMFGLKLRIPAAGDDQVVPDDGRMNAHELGDAFPAQTEPVHQNPFRVRSSPQPPVHNGPHPATAPPRQYGGTAGLKTLLSGVRWRGRLWGPVLSVAGLRPALALFCPCRIKGISSITVFWLLSLCCYRVRENSALFARLKEIEQRYANEPPSILGGGSRTEEMRAEQQAAGKTMFTYSDMDNMPELVKHLIYSHAVNRLGLQVWLVGAGLALGTAANVLSLFVPV